MGLVIPTATCRVPTSLHLLICHTSNMKKSYGNSLIRHSQLLKVARTEKHLGVIEE